MSAHLNSPSIAGQVAFVLASIASLLVLFFVLRLALLTYNHKLIDATPPVYFIESFINGLRFDLRMAVLICAPLMLTLLSVRAMAARRAQCLWLGLCTSLAIFAGLVELDFYREFHQRLNGLVFQYLREDPITVLSMLWHGFPVLRLLLAWALLSALWLWLFRRLDQRTRWPAQPECTELPQKNASDTHTLATRFTSTHSLATRVLVLLLCVALSTIAGRGTLRQGPPLRWGDAYTTESMFANHLGLNNFLTLYAAAKSQFSNARANVWKPTMPDDEALAATQDLLLIDGDRLATDDPAAVRRDYSPAPATRLPIRNVVIILMESFAGHYVGALGSAANITPYFDALAKEGLLFRRFFANGTHTHQGMFATMACFPNLPGFEYLMQMSEGAQSFSGLPQLLSDRGYDNLYVYNGDFAWDNQRGFFSNQGMSRFIGRHDYVDPVVSDPTWGVSDQDMFGRAAQELSALESARPFYALLQTLSNHTPYALPKVLPVVPVSDHGSLNQHLTAMRYADWALGQFFAQARHSPYFDETLFVVVGDHGFGTDKQLTDMDLLRFHVPLLLIAPGIRDAFGPVSDTVGTQVDIVPTIMGRLGDPVRHQCWGRDLLSLDTSDPGFGIIKPSGGDQTVAMLYGDRITVQPKNLEPRVYRYHLGADAHAYRIEADASDEHRLKQLNAYIQVASAALLSDSAGVRESKSADIAGTKASVSSTDATLPLPTATNSRDN